MKLFDTIRYRPFWQSSPTYGFGDVVLSPLGFYFVCYSVESTGNNPDTSGSYWYPLTNPNLVGTPSGPQSFKVANGPVALSPSGISVLVASITLPIGAWLVEAEVGDLAITASLFGSTTPLFPLYSEDGKNYEGIYLSTSAIPSGINLSTVQGPGYSPSITIKAKPVVTL